ncbi:hypothetical protein [Flavobacterium sp.]|uniref:hypothetical protein n=1 Tax=Flavobacterium sp. TaxID=239 RepID=UPI0039E6214C
MKQIFKTVAMLLGCTGCIAAQTTKTSLTDNNTDATSETNETETTVEANNPSRALAFLQDIDKIYFL